MWDIKYPAAASYVLLGWNWHLEGMGLREAGAIAPAVQAEVVPGPAGTELKSGSPL